VIGLDTDVLVRYLVQDDESQAAAATELIDGFTAADPGFVSMVTFVELSWVLLRGCRLDRPEVLAALGTLLTATDLVVEQASVLRQALRATRRGADLADAVIAECGRRAGCDQTSTFDRRAARDSGMTLLA